MIRPMKVDDKAEVIQLAKQFFDERIERDGVMFDANNAALHFDMFIDKVVAFVCEIDGKVVGMIAGMISQGMFCAGKTMQELVWFVDNEHRSCGMRLLAAFEKYAIDNGCSDILMIGFDGDKVCEFYDIVGYKLLQKTYRKGF